MDTAPASAREALDMIRAGLGYLAAADAAQLGAATQAECLRRLERSDAIATAARAGFLAAFTAGQGHAGDGDYSAVSWLIHRTGITRGAAVGHSAWAKRVATHPRRSKEIHHSGTHSAKARRHPLKGDGAFRVANPYRCR